MAQPIQFSAEKMKAAKQLFLQKKNKIRPVCGGQAASTEDSTTLPTIQEKDGPEDGHQGLPEQQQQTVDQVKMRRNWTVPSDREEEHPAHRVQTRRMATATSAVKDPRNQSGNCVPTRPMLTSAVRKKQDIPGDRVQTRRMSTALQQQQDHLEWSAVSDPHALELPGNNMKTQANRVKKPSANRERQEQRGRTWRMSAEPSAVREEEEHLEKPGAYKLPGRNIKPHSNRVQTRRMSAAPSAVREQQEHPGQPSVSDREQLPARTQRKQKTSTRGRQQLQSPPIDGPVEQPSKEAPRTRGRVAPAEDTDVLEGQKQLEQPPKKGPRTRVKSDKVINVRGGQKPKKPESNAVINTLVGRKQMESRATGGVAGQPPNKGSSTRVRGEPAEPDDAVISALAGQKELESWSSVGVAEQPPKGRPRTRVRSAPVQPDTIINALVGQKQIESGSTGGVAEQTPEKGSSTRMLGVPVKPDAVINHHEGQKKLKSRRMDGMAEQPPEKGSHTRVRCAPAEADGVTDDFGSLKQLASGPMDGPAELTTSVRGAPPATGGVIGEVLGEQHCLDDSMHLVPLPAVDECSTEGPALGALHPSLTADVNELEYEEKHTVAPADSSRSHDTDLTWKHFTSVPLEDLKVAVQDCEYGFRFKVENSKGAKGRVQYYYCRRVKVKASQQCERRLMVYIPNGSENNCSLNLRGTHTCHNAKPEDLAKTALSKENVAMVDDMLRSGIPIKDIKKHIRATNLQVSKNRVNYAIKQASQAMYGSGELSLGELAAWAKLKSPTPIDLETAFVIGSDIDGTNGCFRLVYSSKKLLSLFKTLNVMSADCTFKTTLEGYPLMVVCLVDKMRHAHPVAFATITKQEEADYTFVFASLQDQCTRLGICCTVRAFISDGEIALKKAARSVFGEHILLVNCYFHVVECIKTQLTKAKGTAEFKDEILMDLRKIQTAPTPVHFEHACALFLEKYRELPDFVTYFRKYANHEFYRNWYEGALPGYPATNNSLEALNNAIKEHLNRSKEKFGTFKTKIMSVVEMYGKPDRVIHQERLYKIEEERKAYNFFKTGKRTRTVQDWSDRSKYIYLPAGDRTEVTGRDLESFTNLECSTTLEEYFTNMEAVRRVSVTDAHWTWWNCSCCWFFKHNSCYHVVVAAVTCGKYQLRPEANTTPLTKKRPPGRPKKMSKALIID